MLGYLHSPPPLDGGRRLKTYFRAHFPARTTPPGSRQVYLSFFRVFPPRRNRRPRDWRFFRPPVVVPTFCSPLVPFFTPLRLPLVVVYCVTIGPDSLPFRRRPNVLVFRWLGTLLRTFPPRRNGSLLICFLWQGLCCTPILSFFFSRPLHVLRYFPTSRCLKKLPFFTQSCPWAMRRATLPPLLQLREPPSQVSSQA